MPRELYLTVTLERKSFHEAKKQIEELIKVSNSIVWHGIGSPFLDRGRTNLETCRGLSMPC